MNGMSNLCADQHEAAILLADAVLDGSARRAAQEANLCALAVLCTRLQRQEALPRSQALTDAGEMLFSFAAGLLSPGKVLCGQCACGAGVFVPLLHLLLHSNWI